MEDALAWFTDASTTTKLDMGAFLITIACLGSSAVMLYKSRRAAKYRNQLPLPPGPKPLPLVGNLFDVPLGCAWIKLSEWARKYGEIVHINIFGQDIIFLNSVRVANDLLEKRSSIYSDRPRLPLINELMGLGWNYGLMPYGSEWRKHRRMFTNKFGPNVVNAFDPVQEFVSCLLVERLLNNPHDLPTQCKLHAGQSIILSTYGVLVESPTHPFVTTAEVVMDAISDTLRPGGVLVDTLPILKKVPAWVPGSFYQRAAKRWATYVRKLRDDPFVAARENIMDGKPSFPSYVGDFLSACDGDEKGEAEHIVRGTAAVAYGAGYDTTYSAIYAFFLAMVMYPDVQRKAQEELASVIGNSRLPRVADKKNLPYVTAVAKETLRWHSAAPQGIPHQLREDDTYEGFSLPAGSIVVANTWWMAHDPEVHPEPEKFSPERYFNANGELDLSGINPSKYAFGFGRRICPGMYYAENSLFIGIATVLSVLKIEPARDAEGNAIRACLRPSPGVLSHPTPFSCRIRPRSEQAASLIHQARAGTIL